MKRTNWIGLLLIGCLPLTAQANVVLVETSDAGWYNDSIGTVLNLSNTGVDDANAYFPVNNDSSTSFATAPDLSAADSVLGDWLNDPLGTATTKAEWTYEPAIPNSWTPGTEVAVMYQFDTLGATNVVASFGVDNGIFAWLDGVYLGGARAAGSYHLGEHVFNIGDLSAGTHFLQILLEDHGGSNGYAVEITADEYIPGPPPSVPAPAPLGLLLLGLAGLLLRKRV